MWPSLDESGSSATENREFPCGAAFNLPQRRRIPFKDIFNSAAPNVFPPNLTKAQHLKIVEGMSDLEFARFRYCEEMAGAYIAVGMFENMPISAMHMCDQIKLKQALGKDFERWEQSLTKKKSLQSHTLGTLINILKGVPVAANDISYLKWVKDKRDYFVHRLFHDGAWPADVDEKDCRLRTRQLLAIQLWLSRAERNIWSIFKRAGFVELQHLADGGALAMNLGVFDFLEVAEGQNG